MGKFNAIASELISSNAKLTQLFDRSPFSVRSTIKPLSRFTLSNSGHYNLLSSSYQLHSVSSSLHSKSSFSGTPLTLLHHLSITNPLQLRTSDYKRRNMSILASIAPSPVGLTIPSPPAIPEIKYEFSEFVPASFKGDLLIIAVTEETLTKDGSGNITNQAFVSIDDQLDGLLLELANEPDFKGKLNQSAIIRVPNKDFKRVALVGLGKIKSQTSSSVWRSFGNSIVSTAKQSHSETVGLFVIGAESLSPEELVKGAGSVVIGASIGSFDDTRFKSESKPVKLNSITISGLGKKEDVDRPVWEALRLASGHVLTKQLVNAPPNVLTPVAMATVAESLAAAHSDVLTLTVLDEIECEKLGMGAYLAVAAASSINPPRFIHLKYTPPDSKVEKKLALVGKGLTFDSGGYNIKAGAGSLIEWMKIDMGGAGAVLGAAKAIASIQPPGIEVHFIIASCENMISGGGMRPGDILTASNGKTIEVLNTDAEGRLTLADALVYACKLKVDSIVDIATLTGACAGALGGEVAGMMSSSESLSQELIAASKLSGDKICELPLEENYFEGIKSIIADIKNVGPRFGGPITAALFLKQFVGDDIPWAHIDCAGCMFNEKNGGTGYGAILLAKWALSHSKP